MNAAPYSDLETRELIRNLTLECERAARHIRYWTDKPHELRAYAARIESGFAPNSNCLPALCLEYAARAGRDYLA